jgi:hypothetical protein
MKAFVFSLPLLLATILLPVIPVSADVGGGSGVPVTPYSSEQKLSVEQVSLWKDFSRTLRIPAYGNTVISVYGNGIGLIYKKKEKNIAAAAETVAKVPQIPAEIKIPYAFKELLTIDQIDRNIILKKPMTLRQRNELINEIWLQYNPSKHDRQVFVHMEQAIRRLYLRARFITPVLFEFTGVDESGKDISVDFSVVQSFKIVRIENQQALFEITVFPDITPEDLLKLKPSYTELRDRHTRIIRMWLVLQDRKRGDLYLAGVVGKEPRVMLESTGYREMRDSWFEHGRYYIESEERMEHIEINREVKLEYNGNSVWWAIPSVIKDRKYPYRQYFLDRTFRKQHLPHDISPPA